MSFNDDHSYAFPTQENHGEIQENCARKTIAGTSAAGHKHIYIICHQLVCVGAYWAEVVVAALFGAVYQYHTGREREYLFMLISEYRRSLYYRSEWHTITGGAIRRYSNLNLRWTQKPCITLYLHTIFGYHYLLLYVPPQYQ